MNQETNEQYVLWTTLRRINEQISKHEDELFRKTHLTKSQHKILLTMAILSEYNDNPIKITDLVPYDNGSLANISSIIDRMWKKGLVKKTRDGSDQRMVKITVTARGKNLLQKSSNPTTDIVKQYFSVYSDKEIKQLTALLNKLSSKLENDPIRENMFKKVSLDKQVTYLNKLYTNQ